MRWDAVHGDEKRRIRVQAFQEQKGLCAYCMSRLPGPVDQGAFRLEHYLPRASHPAQQLDWENILGVCAGSDGMEAHCDVHRGRLPVHEQTLHVHPGEFPPDAGTQFRYAKTGEIGPAAHLPDRRALEVRETIERLNLNAMRLVRNRALSSTRSQPSVTPRFLDRQLAIACAADRDGRAQEYCQVAILYLETHRRRRTSRSSGRKPPA